MAEKNVGPLLRRYTNLAATIHLLKKKKITLLDPATWDDKVDVDYMKQCSKWLQRPVLALCFCQGQERYHHWRVYASGTDGVCIVFERERLLHTLSAKYEGLLHDDVTYKSYSEASTNPPDVLDLPFLKRPAYKDEKEYRIVRLFDEDKESAPARDYDIDLSCIRRIVLSPWLPKELCASVRKVLTSIEGCKDLDVRRSALIESEIWKQFGKAAYGEEDKMAASMPDWMASDSE